MAESSDDDDDEMARIRQFKVVLLGDGAVGKSSLATRFARDQFAQRYKQTIGVDFFMRHLDLPGGVRAAMQVWDIGGQSIGSQMTSKYLFGAQAVVLVYDATSYESFENLEDWLRLVYRVFPPPSDGGMGVPGGGGGAGTGGPRPVLALMANKTDLGHLRAVKREEHLAFARENGMSAYYASAKTGDRVFASFKHLAAQMCGVQLSAAEVAGALSPVEAALPNYPQNDPAIHVSTAGAVHAPRQLLRQPETASMGKRGCVLQ